MQLVFFKSFQKFSGGHSGDSLPCSFALSGLIEFQGFYFPLHRYCKIEVICCKKRFGTSDLQFPSYVEAYPYTEIGASIHIIVDGLTRVIL